MKLAILSTGPQLYSTRRLAAAATRRGHEVEILDTLKLAIDVRDGEPGVFYGDRSIADVDAILPRIGTSISAFGTTVVRQFELMGIYTPSPADSIAASRDKMRAIQILCQHDLRVPRTTLVRDRRDVASAIDRVGGAPVVIKLLEGTQGVGVILAETTTAAEAIIETLQSVKQQVLVQAFVSESKGRDLRALVVGHRVVAAMRRIAQGEEFRANIHRGGLAEPIELDERTARTAIHAAQALGLRVAGVDMLESHDGPQVLEVNSSPGLEGIETTTRLDVASAIVDDVAAQVEFPGIDVRRRLTPDSGFGVAELTIHKGLGLAGRTLRDSRLRDRDLRILALYRGSRTISNPAGDLMLEAGDRLLCFGRLQSMRRLAVDGGQRRRHGTPASWP
ncbi:MAG: RimK family alpha-L-glutamate ligase [Acidobacteriota bacterium]